MAYIIETFMNLNWFFSGKPDSTIKAIAQLPAFYYFNADMRSIFYILIFALFVGMLIYSPDDSSARDGFVQPRATRVATPKPTIELPNTDFEWHKINRLGLTVTNNGFLGTGYLSGGLIDPETGDRVMACEYPFHSDVEYLWVGGLWIGAIVGRDTVVSTTAEGYYDLVEFWPDAGEKGAMVRRSSQPYSHVYSIDAISEEDVICTYTDTLVNPGFVYTDPIDNRPHHPLNIEITQRTFGWSYDYAEDFILLDYSLRNIGPYPLKQIYIGFVNDADAYHISKSWGADSWMDDICGYKETIPSPFWPGYEDSIRVAWIADNDGDPNAGAYDFSSTTGATAVRVIRTPSDSLEYSFNWWVTQYSPQSDWGPRQVTEKKPFRNFGSHFGTPLGDKNKYYMLSTREFDYDQLEAAISHTGDFWLSPPGDAVNYADGNNSIYLFSFGPFDLMPGDTLPVTLAYIGGDNFHHNPHAFENIYNPFNPKPYQDQLDFSKLGKNSIWADWVYDNPGYDTDGDNDSGLARWFVNEYGTDSTYAFYKGDGVPDFRGASPPPSPKLRVTPGHGTLTLNWNGQVSEEYVDVFSGDKDFEGFKIYISEGLRYTDFILLATFDKRDYNVHTWNETLRRWEISPAPVEYDSLQIIYGADFDPDIYDEQNPLPPQAANNYAEVYTYFTPQYWNQSDLSNPNGIHKIYPHADITDPSDTTEDGTHRFYEYEYTITGLPPSRPVYVSVTAFDYGSRRHMMSVLEGSRLQNATYAYPLTSSDVVEQEAIPVIVYPNPYRIDGGYAAAGYENRDRTRSAERSRLITFANLPKICTIRIFTVSGDLVKELKHYKPDGGPDSQIETWNLLSRNTQAITTGMYIWSVTTDSDEQIGKLVIIK